MKLVQNHWLNWGFQGNPFDTNALSLHSQKLPITRAFVGRTMDSDESRHLLNIIKNPGGGRGIVEGDIGVGKTTLVNYHRYLWENEAEDLLFTPIKEISVYGNWKAKDFLMEILGHLSNKLLCLLEGKKHRQNKLLKKIRFLNEVFYHESFNIQGSVFGFGVGCGSQAQLNIPSLTESQLVAYLMDIVSEIKKLGYKGVFLHFDNLELLSRCDLLNSQRLFEEIRDIMQLPDIYYIFVAHTGFFSQVIGSCERVSSIMGWPIKVPPLTKDEVIKAINIRYELLALKKHIIKPVEEEFIIKLYDFYRGKIRFIMDAIAQTILNYLGQSKTLSCQSAENILKEIILGAVRLIPKSK